MASGFFIALEGIDGAGTTSQLLPVAQALRALGHEVALTAEPSKGEVGLLLRQALQGHIAMGEAAMALLFAADRLHHVQQDVTSHLAEGRIVITDRYLLSSLAYQSTALGLDWVKTINRHAPQPDAHLFFRVCCETAKQRRLARGGPVEHFDADSRQQAVARGYEALVVGPEAMPNIYIVDAEKSLSEVTTQVVRCIKDVMQAHQASRAEPHREPDAWG